MPSHSESCASTAGRPRRPQRLLLQWHVTDRCNLRCAHCYQESHAGTDLPLERLREIARQFVDWLRRCGLQPDPTRPPGHINLTGGEPFMRADFLPLLEELARQREWFRFAILTNGSFLTPDVIARLRELQPDFIQLSLEGKPETHDRLRGPGDHERTLRVLGRLRAAGLRSMVAFTAHQANYREFGGVAEAARRAGANRVWADRLIPLGQAVAHDAGLACLDPAQTREFLLVMDQARRNASQGLRRRTEVPCHRALQFLVAGGTPYRCHAGESLLAVAANGDVYPCRRLPIPVGNVFETPLADLWESHQLLRRLREPSQVPAECAHCLYRSACRGGLRCLAHAITGDPFRADPGCWLAQRPAAAPVAAPPRTQLPCSAGGIAGPLPPAHGSLRISQG